MTTLKSTAAPVQHPDRLYIDGQWVAPSSDATIEVIDSGTEELFFRVAEAQAADIDRAVGAARTAFDHGPWPRLTHEKRAGYRRAMVAQLRSRAGEIGEIWPRQSGVLHGLAVAMTDGDAATLDMEIGLGGVKQSGVGREGGIQGLLPYLESKTVLLGSAPDKYKDHLHSRPTMPVL
jgi:acyl-CoA reductase-like NAD-dependent aldehyde dehydrogenase